MKKLILFNSIILCILIPIILIFPSHEWIEAAFIKSAFYFLFVTFILWLTFLFKIGYNNIYTFIKKHAVGLLLSICVTIMIFTISPPNFKILGDETNLLGVSMSMYKNKTSHVPLYGLFDQVFKYAIDKRPVFYPFLTSIVHSFTGYKAANSFIVNFSSSVCTLFLFYLFLSYYFSQKLSLISILLVASSPIFTFWSTSGGFEPVNLNCLMFVFIFLYQFLKTKNINFFILLMLTMILFSQCRYESIIFFIPLVILIPVLIREKLFLKSFWITICTLIFLIPAFWQRRLFLNRADSVNDYLNVSEISNTQSAFNLNNFLNNSIDNLYVFIGIDPSYGFSPVIAILAILGIYLFIRKIIFNSKKISWDIKQISLFYAISILLLVSIHFSYFWGNFSTAGSNRLAYIYLPYLIFPAIYSIHKIEHIVYATSYFVPILFLFHLIFFLPYSADQNKIKTLIKPIEYEKTLSYLNKYYRNDNKSNLLIISENPGCYLVQGYGSIYFSIANNIKEDIKSIHTKRMNRVIIIQKYNSLFNSSSLSTRLDSEFRYHKVGVIPVLPGLWLKVSELDEII